ncbi:ankyrin and armadillo repeat-containing protein-like [Protopterus annectens]|uniref:ankyrin and armadillo repeat-containing protein-like n=1 Tax=Protopterus annectens TaxID=7888 RepID=UPI001CF9D42B|nr:ankyrin and armadillo repeat-containing protein-like [Protopterus annectens]
MGSQRRKERKPYFSNQGQVYEEKTRKDNLLRIPIMYARKLLASLAHTRAGIPDAIVTLGAVEHLCYQLHSVEEQVRTAAAVALGYLTFNRTAHRHLLVQCRNTPGLYDLLTENLSKDAKICKDFTDEFKRQKIVGLPSQSLVINGGPPVIPQQRKATARSRKDGHTAFELPPFDFLRLNVNSAPAFLVQSRTANSSSRLKSAALSLPAQTPIVTKQTKLTSSSANQFKTEKKMKKEDKAT